MGKGILIAGAARSGTSALAGALGVCGVELGSKHLPANPYNPKGYCELPDVLELHDRCLHSFDQAWDSLNPLPTGWQGSDAAQRARHEIRTIFEREFSGRDVWAVKDARLGRLLPLWQDELGAENLRIVVPVRHPFEVAQSLVRFEGRSWSESLLYWLFHLFETERTSRAFPRVYTTYDDLLSDPVGLLHRIETQLELALPLPAAERFLPLKGWIEPGLRTFHRHSESSSDPELAALQALTHSIYHQFLGEKLFSNPARVDALHSQCFGATFTSLATSLWEHRVSAARERDLLQLRLSSAEAWLNGPWLRRAFHRWHDPVHPRARRTFGQRLALSFRTRLQPLFSGLADSPIGTEVQPRTMR